MLLETVALALLLATTPPAGEPVRMAVAIDYSPVWPYDKKPGDLFVYLDGDLLAWVPKGGQYAPTPTVRFSRDVDPGRHVLRFLHEKHERQGKRGWKHEARVSDVEVLFQLEPGGSGEIAAQVVEKKQVFATEPGPVHVTVGQDGRILQNVLDAGRPLVSWPRLCEAIEANLEPGRKVPKKVQAELEECVRWDSLWTSADHAMTRDQVRAVLERYDYEPRSYRRYD